MKFFFWILLFWDQKIQLIFIPDKNNMERKISKTLRHWWNFFLMTRTHDGWIKLFFTLAIALFFSFIKAQNKHTHINILIERINQYIKPEIWLNMDIYHISWTMNENWKIIIISFGYIFFSSSINKHLRILHFNHQICWNI